MLKYRSFLLPVITLFAAAFLLTKQSRTLAAVRLEKSLVQKQVAAFQKDPSPGTIPDESLTTHLRTSGKSNINWFRIAELIGGAGRNGIFARQELFRARARISAMNPPELLAALAEVKAKGIDTDARGEIDALLITALMKKDHRAAADYLIIPENNHRGLPGNLLRDTMEAWTSSDFPTALAWFDANVAAGGFTSRSLEGRDNRRFGIEAVILARLVLSDAATAASRLNAYPKPDRSYVLGRIADNNRRADRRPDDKEVASYVTLARQTLPEGQQTKFVSSVIAPFSRTGDYERIDGLLDRVAASPGERAATVAAAAEQRFSPLAKDNLTIEKIDLFRQWAATQSPATVDRITGRSLADHLVNRSGGDDPTATVDQLLAHYHDASGNDEVLLGFLQSKPYGADGSKARELAKKFHDPARRNEYLRQLEADPFSR